MKKLNLEKGFTLIELLVVIAIIGILSSVVIASLNSARGRSQAVATKASLKSVQTTLTMCNNDNLAITSPTGGTALCTGYAALPTAAQLNAGTSATYAVTGSQGSYTLTVTLAGHPISACNTTAWTITESAVTEPANCK